MGRIILLVFSSIGRRDKVENPEKIKLTRKDKTATSSARKVFSYL